MTHQKILKLLEGRDSTRPMRFDDLVEASGLQPDTLTMVLDQMASGLPASINRATITKGGLTQVMVWPTGVIGPFLNPSQLSQQQYRRSQEQPGPGRRAHKSASYAHKNEADAHETAAKVQPNTAKTGQETTMEAVKEHGRGGSTPSPINQAIYNKIVEHPGIVHAALIKHVLAECEGATEKRIVKTIGNMRHITKKIRVEGERGNYTYRLNRDAVTPTPPAQKKAKPERVAKVRPGKVVTGAEAAALRGDPQPKEHAPAHVISDTKAPHSIPAALLREREIEDEPFTLMISDDNHLHVGIGEEMYHFNEVQTARLHRFMNRVQLGVAA